MSLVNTITQIQENSNLFCQYRPEYFPIPSAASLVVARAYNAYTVSYYLNK